MPSAIGTYLSCRAEERAEEQKKIGENYFVRHSVLAIDLRLKPFNEVLARAIIYSAADGTGRHGERREAHNTSEALPAMNYKFTLRARWNCPKLNQNRLPHPLKPIRAKLIWTPHWRASRCVPSARQRAPHCDGPNGVGLITLELISQSISLTPIFMDRLLVYQFIRRLEWFVGNFMPLAWHLLPLVSRVASAAWIIEFVPRVDYG